MFGLFKKKNQLKELSNEIINFSKVIWKMFDFLEKNKKKISKKIIIDELAKLNVGIIDDGLKKSFRLAHPTSHKWISATIECDDDDWSKYRYTLIGIMSFGGASVSFDFKDKEIRCFLIDNQYMPAGELGKHLHNEIVKLSGFKDSNSQF